MPHAGFPIEEVAKYPLPGMIGPSKITFSPDDTLVTYLYSRDHTLSADLLAYEVETRKDVLLVQPPGSGDTDENVSREEALRRERLRERATGITQYSWGVGNTQLLVPLQGKIYVKDRPDAPLRLLVDGRGIPVLDPQISPNGASVAFVQDSEIYVVPFPGGTPQQVTHGARENGKIHGLAEYIAQEEMDRQRGYWWSPDSQSIAFTEVDESHIPAYPILHYGQKSDTASSVEEHRYPFAGQANAKIKLGVVSADGGDPIWMDLGEDEDIYLTRVAWLPGGELVAQVENRPQTQLDLIQFDPQTGEGTILLRETSDVWINLNAMFRALKQPREDGGSFIWASERTGFQHLYLYDAEGRLVRPLTQGSWLVDAVVSVDEGEGIVYFNASREGPLESQLYSVSLNGSDIRRITREPGTHTIAIDHKHRRFVDTYQTIATPPVTTLRSLVDGSMLAALHGEPDPRVEQLKLQSPELVTLESRDGVTLHGAVFRPPGHTSPDSTGPYPTIISVYGGPHVQRVTNSWRTVLDMRAQYLANQGFLVFVLDNRGSARRGLGFEGAIKNKLGEIEVNDQIDGVRWLIDQGLADPERVGIYGWSYGGYMSAMCLARAPEVFKVAVAGAPVTHYDGYDTHYTERYMGAPQENPEGYENGSVMHHVSNIRGRLLLIHGLIDENVHFRHTVRLINTLIAARKPYDLLLFPTERHSPRKLADRVYMEERIRDYFLQYL